MLHGGVFVEQCITEVNKSAAIVNNGPLVTINECIKPLLKAPAVRKAPVSPSSILLEYKVYS